MVSLLALPIKSGTLFDDLLGKPEATFRGLEGVWVVVPDELPKDAKGDDGLAIDADWLKGIAELQLRKAGIRVLSSEEWLKSAGCPLMVLRVHLHQKKELPGLWAYCASACLMQQVALVRAPDQKAAAQTWDARGHMGMGGANTLRDALRRIVEDQVDEFANVYLGQNPKK